MNAELRSMISDKNDNESFTVSSCLSKFVINGSMFNINELI